MSEFIVFNRLAKKKPSSFKAKYMRNNYQAKCAMMEPYVRIIKATHQGVIDFLYRRKVRNRCTCYDINIIKGESAKLHVKAHFYFGSWISLACIHGYMADFSQSDKLSASFRCLLAIPTKSMFQYAG